MPRTRIPVGLVSQICIEPKLKGVSAVYLVEAETENQADYLEDMFRELSPEVESLQLSSGKLVSYAVQLQAHNQTLLEDIEAFLKRNYGFVILHRSFDSMIYEIVRELCKDSGSTLLPIPKCDICGKPDPFPETIVRLLDEKNTNVACRTYCGTCTAETAVGNNKEFVMALLEADRGGLGVFRQKKLVRSRSSHKRVAFRIKSDAEQQFAIRP